MKRATIRRRDVNGKALRDEQGWSTEIHGVPVVISRRSPQDRWEVCEPRTGMPISGSMGGRREKVLAYVVERVERAAGSRGISPRQFLEEMIDTYVRKHAVLAEREAVR